MDGWMDLCRLFIGRPKAMIRSQQVRGMPIKPNHLYGNCDNDNKKKKNKKNAIIFIIIAVLTIVVTMLAVVVLVRGGRGGEGER